MSINNQETDELLKLIPASRRKPEQVARWYDTRDSPTYTLLREPINLSELNSCNHRMAIWRDNNTLTYVIPSAIGGLPDFEQRLLSLMFFDDGPQFYIVGKTDNAVVETALFFLSLDEPREQNSRLFVDSFGGNGFDFRDAGTQFLEHIFVISPSREVTFGNVTLSNEQSIVLASRSPSIRLSLSGGVFEDGGNAFVDALENRNSSFGSLTFDGSTSLTEENLKRLFQVDLISELRLSGFKEELALLPFSAKVDHLDYDMRTSSLLKADFQTLDIVPKQLSLKLYLEIESFPTDLMLPFLRLVADLGHFVELKIEFCLFVPVMTIPDCVMPELILATLANSNLRVLDLSSNISHSLNWNPHIRALLEGLKEHKGLCLLKVTADDHAFGPDYCYLHQFLSHNRHITVTDERGYVHSDGSSIDELYSLNRFYRGSADLVVKPPSDRSSLVATTLMESASNDFQRSALLLSNHVDALYEMVQVARLDEIRQDDDPPSRPKRAMRIQPPRAAKKSARSFP